MRLPALLLAAVLAGALAAGCASTPTTRGEDPSLPVFDPAAPRVVLVGASPEQAKAVAMGAAVGKGWRIAESADNLLVMQRPLNPAAAEAVAPGASLSPVPARVEVRTGFLPRAGGTEVVLQADVLTVEPKQGETRHPFTESYRGELKASLDSLRRSWETADWRVAGALPPVPEPAPPVDLSTDVPPASAATPTAVPEEDLTAGPDDRGAGAPVAALSTPVPQGPPAAAAAPTRAALTPPTSTVAGSNDMLRLDAPRTTGVWAYYAEHYARVRGCTLAGEGAVLIRKTPDYEEHRVYCEGGKTFLVRCNAGTCRGLE